MPLRTPFGPKNAQALFQRLMDEVLRELRPVARAFIDDTIVHTKGFQAHLAALRAVFEKLRLYKIKVHPKKIRILFPEIAFLGHMVNPIGLKPQEVKVAAIMRIPYPTSCHGAEAANGDHQLLSEVSEGVQHDCSPPERPSEEGR